MPTPWNIKSSLKMVEFHRNFVQVSTLGSTGLSRLVVLRTFDGACANVIPKFRWRTKTGQCINRRSNFRTFTSNYPLQHHFPTFADFFCANSTINIFGKKLCTHLRSSYCVLHATPISIKPSLIAWSVLSVRAYGGLSKKEGCRRSNHDRLTRGGLPKWNFVSDVNTSYVLSHSNRLEKLPAIQQTASNCLGCGARVFTLSL